MDTTLSNTSLVTDSRLYVEIVCTEIAPRTFSFGLEISGGDGLDEWGFEWDLGDGTSSDSAELVHTYAERGNYYVTVQAAFIEPKDKYGSGEDGFMETFDHNPIRACFEVKAD